MAAVPADVEKAAEAPVAATDEDDRDVAGVRRGVGAGLRHHPGVADVLPCRREDQLALAPQLLRVDVPRPRERLLHSETVIVRRFALPLAVALLLAGCGGEGQTAAPATTVETATAPPQIDTVSGTETVPQDVTSFGVYFLREGKVAPAYRTVPQTEAVGTAALEALLAGPTADETSLGLTSTVPVGTELEGLDVKDGIATVDLSPEFGPLRDPVEVAENLA